MKKYFGIFLAILFLVVQTASVLHMAEHGFAEHKHDGHTCEISLYYHHDKLADAPSVDMPVDTAFITLAPLPFSAPALWQVQYYSSIPRAPPTLA